jgi:hypothetical protein
VSSLPDYAQTSLMIRRRFKVVLILVAVYTSELRRLLPSNTPLTKQKLTMLLTQGIEEASAVDLPVYRIDAEILTSLLLRLLANKS